MYAVLLSELMTPATGAVGVTPLALLTRATLVRTAGGGCVLGDNRSGAGIGNEGEGGVRGGEDAGDGGGNGRGELERRPWWCWRS